MKLATQPEPDLDESPERKAELILVEELLERCKEHGIPAELDAQSFGIFAQLELPSGRTRRNLWIGARRVQALLDVPFQDVVLLGRLQAVCNCKAGSIEAYVVSAAGRNPTMQLLRLLNRDPETDVPIIALERGKTRVTIGPPSPVLRGVLGPLTSGNVDPLAIRITGLDVQRHDDALAVLERLADAIFLEIDAELGVPLVLDKGRSGGGIQRWRHDREPEISFPASEYDSDPMALYWYGRGATNMPLLQFLAFYQVLEFYFPVYAEQEVRRRVKGVVKDPKFNPHNEQEISRILRTMRIASGRGGGDERSQLRAVIKACGDPDLIRDLIRKPQFRAEYFEKKKGGPARHALRPQLGDQDLIDAVADRVYEIRCRIVHTKDSSADDERLLPFSQEAEQLQPDIDLLESLARAALVASSRELKLSPDPA